MKLHFIGKILMIIGIVGLVLVAAVGSYLLGTAKTVTLINPNAPSVVSLNKSMYQKGDNVAEIYGNPLDKQVKLVLMDQKKVIHPEEDPTLMLYPVDKQKGDNPIQAQSVWLFMRSSLIGFSVVTVIGLLLMTRKRR